MTTKHIPVLIDSIMNILIQEISPLKGKTVFDGTFGAGGYSKRFLEKGMSVTACDRDPEVIKNNSIKDSKLKLFEGSYADIIKQTKKKMIL
ncbi:16S rRNA (cytosine(1402)-N(4))-methyltransferase [Candidatus Gracilibacteria bacterium]|nr:16S rRNA (cytosine(1402)-N(4))-methyltransferase [Candidatus Gracilibacteria bacterium]